MEIKRKSGCSTYIRKIHFKTKTVIREKVGHYIIIKGSIQEAMTIVNICATYIRAHKYIKQILTGIKGETHSSTVIVGELKHPLTSMNRPSRQKFNKETQALNYTLGQMNLIHIYIYGTFLPKAAEYTFFSSIHGTFFRIDYMVGHKRSLRKFKKIEVIPGIFSDHNTVKLEIKQQQQQQTEKHTNMWNIV